jgi:O-antigen/teichoic acid export membrane protein
MLRAGKGAVYVAIQSVSQFAIGLFYYSILARLLTEAEIGIISTLSFTSSIFIIVANLSLPIAATKHISGFMGQNDEESASSVAKKTIRLVILIATLVLAGIYVTLPFLFEGDQSIIVLVMIACATGFFATIKTTYLAFLRGLQMFGKYSITITLAVITNRVIGIVLILLNFNLLGVVTGWLIGEVIGVILVTSFYRGTLPKTEKSYSSRQLLTFSIPLFFTTLIGTVSTWADRIIFLGLTSDLEKLGIYDFAIRGSHTLALIWLTVSVITLPAFSELFSQTNKRGLSEAISKTIRYLAYIIFPAAFGLATISKTAMALLYGWQYALGNMLLAILATFSIFSAFGAVVGSALQSMGETRVFIKTTLASLLTNFLISFTLIPILNVVGSTIAQAATMVVGFTYAFYELRKRLKITINRDVLWKPLLAASIMVLPLLFFESYYSGVVSNNSAINIILEIGVGVLTYSVMLIVVRAFNEQDFNELEKITPKPFLKLLQLLKKIFIRER